jgi:hypothetical protein
MTATRYAFTGSCHCGAIRLRLETTKAADALQLRSCQCGFCTRHGTITVSDPAGHAVIELGAVARTYEFGTRTATSLICSRCGVYAGAFLQEGGKAWSIANVRGLAIAAFAGRAGEPMRYEHETPEERIARRKQRWTPSVLNFMVC